MSSGGNEQNRGYLSPEGMRAGTEKLFGVSASVAKRWRGRPPPPPVLFSGHPRRSRFGRARPVVVTAIQTQTTVSDQIGRLVVCVLLKSCFSIATVLLKTIDDNLRERVLVVVTGE